MKYTTLSRRTAAAGAASALVTGALVGATTTAAQADPVVNNTYTCTAAGQTFPVFLTSNAPGIEAFPEISAGTDLGPGLLSVTNTFTIPDGVYKFMSNAGVTTVSAPTFSGAFGDTPIGVDGVSVTLAGMTQNANTTWSSDSTDADGDGVEGTGFNAAFEVPAAGSYEILSPATLDLVATTAAGGQIPVACVTADGTTAGAYHQIQVNKNASTSKATAVNSPVTKGEVAKVKVKVSAPNETPTGKVIFKKGAKNLGSVSLNARGIAILKTKALAVGANKITTTYRGDGYTTGSKATTTVTVKR